MMIKRNLYMLVGLPYSGKSTWIKQHSGYVSDYHVVSTDLHIERHAKENRLTYNDVFHDFIKTAEKIMYNDLSRFIKYSKCDIYWDQTNLSVKSRKKNFERIPKIYSNTFNYVAVVFPMPTDFSLKQRREKRREKFINDEIFDRMVASYQTPSFDEGFNEIWIIDTKERNDING